MLDTKGNVVRWDNPRFEIPDLGAGEEAQVSITIPEAERRPYEMRLHLDLVREGAGWFSAVGSNEFPQVEIVFKHVELSSLSNRPEYSNARRLQTRVPALDNAALLAFFAIAKARREMRLNEKSAEVLNAGMGYPQAWIRDCATSVRAAYFILGDGAGRGCIDVHLLKQREDGYVYDWVSHDGATGKNTVETDQESSLVIAAAEYVRASGNKNYVLEAIAGKPIIQHLECALEYVWSQRRDGKTGLVLGAHTIDWGDVQINGVAYRDAVNISEDSPLTVDIYDNAMYALAIQRYLDLLPAKREAFAASQKKWRNRLGFIRDTTKKILWDKRRGYFVMHRHVTPLKHGFNEDTMFPMGGNAVAIEAGLADKAMVGRIVAKVLLEQKRHGAATISGVLYPPYPDGVYQHSAVNKAYYYQNGGLWDWFGLRMVRVMYRHGYRTRAGEALREIAAKVVRNRTFSEWDALDGSARGSRDYLGAAGQYIAALMEMRALLTK